ncbi:MAG: restriction endonuclease subunit S [Bacteroidetes bacterium]|nr:restriction endonuclease subunit S [Bacteroidota bacterium]
MKTYSKYKPAKLKWLSKIPSHWDEGKISYFFELGRGRVISELDLNPDGLFPVYSSQTKNDGCMGFIDTYDFDGDLLTWTTDGANAGTVFYRSGKFNCTNVCGTLQPKGELNLKFYLYYLTFANTFLQRPDTNGAKIMNNEMARIYCLIPPLNEQNRIAEYLDDQTGLIDDLIKQQEKLIFLLKEKRLSIIHEAVTKGIDLSVSLKPTNVDWIGNIPNHWRIERLKFIYRIKKEISGELGHNVLSVTQKGIKIRDLENLKGQLSMDYSKYQLVNAGDFIMNHMDLLTGFIDISKWDGVTSPDYRVFSSINKDISDQYYLYIFQFCYYNKIFFGLGQGVSQLGRWRMPAESFNNFIVPLPSLQEQLIIVEYIKKSTSLIDLIIEKEEAVIEKLYEYRQSIISEAVTGMFDVNDWVTSKIKSQVI